MAIIERMPVFNTEVARQTSDSEVIKGIVGRIEKRTIPVDKLNGHDLYKTLKRSAYPFTATDPFSGKEEILIAAPQLTSNDLNKIDKSERILRKLGTNAVNNGLKLGIINNSTAEEFLNDPNKIKVLSPKNYTGHTPVTNNSQNQTVTPGRSVIPAMQMQEIFSGKKISRRAFLGVSTVTIAGLVLSSCKPLPINATEILPTVTSGGQNSNETSTTKEATAIPTPTRPEEIGGAGGSIYTPDQMDMISNGEFLNQENQYKQWQNNYWGLADNAPFNLKTKELHYVYLFDANKAFVILKAGGDYEGRTFALPIKNGVFMIAPPTTPKGNFNIPVGFGPLEVSGGNYTLAFKNGVLVRIDSKGNIVEKLNMKTASWEKEKFSVLTPGSLEDCKRLNEMELSDIPLINQKLSEIKIDPNTVPSYSNALPTEDIKKLKMPFSMPIVIEVKEGEQLKADFCGYYDGKYVIGMPFKRMGSNIVGHLLLGLYEPIQKEYFNLTEHNEAYEQYNKLDKNYERLIGKNGNIKTALIQIILDPSYAEKGAIWDNLLDLIPQDITEYKINIGLLISHQTIHPETREMIKLGDEKLLFEKLGKIIIPTITIGMN